MFQPTLVCLDLGGVVVRTCPDWECGARRAGLPYRSVADSPEAGSTIRELSRLYDVDRLDRAGYLREVSRAVGEVYNPEEVGRIHDAWLLGEFSGLAELLDDLHAARIPSACLSNTNRRHWELLEGNGGPAAADETGATSASSGTSRFPAFHRIRQRFASFHFAAAKPDPAIYSAFEEAVLRGAWPRSGPDGASGLETGPAPAPVSSTGNAIPPRIVFFDDLEENVEAARRAGWTAWRILPGEEPAFQIRRSLRELQLPL